MGEVYQLFQENIAGVMLDFGFFKELRTHVGRDANIVVGDRRFQA